jgi:ABC-2 type transport system permease protein
MVQGMINSLHLYWRYVGASVRSQMQYRASFAMETLGQFGVFGVGFIGILVLFSRFDSLEGWNLPEVASSTASFTSASP